MILRTNIRSIWATYPGHITRFLHEDAIFLPFLLFFWWASYMATIQKIIGLDLVLWTKIAWKIQIWSWMWGMRCITMSNLRFLMILEHFIHFLTYIRQLFPMLSTSAKDKNPLILTNFLCSFIWRVSHALHLTASWTFDMI